VTSRVERYWAQFLASIPDGEPRPERYVDAFFFGIRPEHAPAITPLVLEGTKTATGSLLWSLEAEGKPPARAGDHWIVTNGGDDPACVIVTTDARVIPFDEVGEDYARQGGEAGCTLAGWRDLYWRYIVGECERLGRDPHEKAPLVMERFEVVYAEPPVLQASG
jgi:uncharacterized protein YhfF